MVHLFKQVLFGSFILQVVNTLQPEPVLCIKLVLGLFLERAVMNPRAALLESGPFGSLFSDKAASFYF